VRRAAASAPVLLRFPAEASRCEAWGRLAELSASSASLSTQATMRRGERCLLSFEIGLERFKDLPAEIGWVERDADGFWVAEVRFRDEVDKRRLARALLDALAR
jgi:hypothetical protein